MLEVTMTHRFDDSDPEYRLTTDEALTLRRNRWIGLGTEGFGTEWDRYRLIRLVLSNARVFDASVSFLGNLPAVQCTIQTCGDRANGRLAAIALGSPLPRLVGSMHHKDVEGLCLNWLTNTGLCKATWNGGRAFPGIDGLGWSAEGEEVLAQVTVSVDRALVKKKCDQLVALRTANRKLFFFALASTSGSCPTEVTFTPIEHVFAHLDQFDAGKKTH